MATLHKKRMPFLCVVALNLYYNTTRFFCKRKIIVYFTTKL
nr:MAG TPA: hypothetical protein [Caudoviricetes sp.]